MPLPERLSTKLVGWWIFPRCPQPFLRSNSTPTVSESCRNELVQPSRLLPAPERAAHLRRHPCSNVLCPRANVCVTRHPRDSCCSPFAPPTSPNRLRALPLLNSRKSFMTSTGAILTNEYVVWFSRAILFIVGGVFLETLNRLRKIDAEAHKDDPADGSHHHHQHSTTGSAYTHLNSSASLPPGPSTSSADLQHKVRLFYTQRNLYLSLFAMFMILVLWRRIKDIWAALNYEETAAEQARKIQAMNQQISLLTLELASPSPAPVKPIEATSSTPKRVEPVSDEIELMPIESEGPRKRAGKSAEGDVRVE
ncbi:hypothetical protein BDK51DRAFT_48166 [Blyttiomyces helicus]|uniref:BAP29/BAP31 transmembrane domain-containing protein n=1 Tax=Blyttiomyces helicus TaxID=388810 RepID=A0A4P9WHZ0_9FUNG|nr:hypothetical protein BDK51DRAFT_48166 [Blyttiomyces helicus]|eukprot:RKO92461.1 hypothetical protein BDK51DRAFT_48166 [Blyttiomyces helicus]